jgi:hypothetical protein
MSLCWKKLCETICCHVSSGNLSNCDGAGIHFLAEPVIVNVDVTELGPHLGLLLGE